MDLDVRHFVKIKLETLSQSFCIDGKCQSPRQSAAVEVPKTKIVPPHIHQEEQIVWFCPNRFVCKDLHSLTWPLKMDGWNTSFLLGWPIFRGYVSFREGSIPDIKLRVLLLGTCFSFESEHGTEFCYFLGVYRCCNCVMQYMPFGMSFSPKKGRSRLEFFFGNSQLS